MSKRFAAAARDMARRPSWPSIAVWADASRRRISGGTTTRMRRSGDYFARFDLGKIEEIARSEIPHWRPDTAFPKSFARWQTDLRPAGIQSVADLYTKRNLWALAALRAGAAASSCPQAALFALTAISLAVSRMQRYSPASGFPNMLLVGTYYIPPVGREIEAGTWYEGKLRALVKGYAAIRREMPPDGEGLIAMADARQLDLPDDSIDYIFTDPPYADAVQYGELNFVWESWLGGTPDWHGDEIVVNHARGKDAGDWARSLAAAMGECRRVLKPGRCLSLCYHDTSAGRWAMLQDLMHEAGFAIDSGRRRRKHRNGPEVVQSVDVEQGNQARPGDQFSQANAGPTQAVPAGRGNRNGRPADSLRLFGRAWKRHEGPALRRPGQPVGLPGPDAGF